MIRNTRSLKGAALLLVALVMPFVSCDFAIDFFDQKDKLAVTESNSKDKGASEDKGASGTTNSPNSPGGATGDTKPGADGSSTGGSGNPTSGSGSGSGGEGNGAATGSTTGNGGGSGSSPAVPGSPPPETGGTDGGASGGDASNPDSVVPAPGGSDVGGEPVPDPPSTPPSQQEKVEQSVADWSSFQSALTGSSVDTLNLTGGISTATARPGGDEVLVMGNPAKDLVINGNGRELSLDYAGIILAGNVTFNDVVLNFRNGVRNCIVANGYTLTLNKVRPDSISSRNSIHLFCGEITNHSLGQLPPAGPHGKIVVQGTDNQLGNIYAGSLDDAYEAGQAANNDFKGPATIILDKGVTGQFGNVYSHGARESRGEGKPDAFYNDVSKYICSGDVTVSLGSSRITNFTLDGRTGGATNATLRYVDDGKGYRASPTLIGIGRLELAGSDPQPSLVPAAGSSFAAGASLSLPANTKLYLTSLDASGSFDFSSLEGGGLLVLNPFQSVTMSGNVSGETRLAIEDVDYWGTNSTGNPVTNHGYIVAERSADSSFVLLPPSSDETLTLTKSANGEWSVPAASGSTTTKVKSFSLNSPGTIPVGSSDVSVPITSSGAALSHIPATITVNGVAANSSYSDSFGYEYIVTVGGKSLGIYFTLSDDGLNEVIFLYENNGIPLSGSYKLEMTVPAANTVNGQELKSTIAFTVN